MINAFEWLKWLHDLTRAKTTQSTKLMNKSSICSVSCRRLLSSFYGVVSKYPQIMELITLPHIVKEPGFSLVTGQYCTMPKALLFLMSLWTLMLLVLIENQVTNRFCLGIAIWEAHRTQDIIDYKVCCV